MILARVKNKICISKFIFILCPSNLGLKYCIFTCIFLGKLFYFTTHAIKKGGVVLPRARDPFPDTIELPFCKTNINSIVDKHSVNLRIHLHIINIKYNMNHTISSLLYNALIFTKCICNTIVFFDNNQGCLMVLQMGLKDWMKHIYVDQTSFTSGLSCH